MQTLVDGMNHVCDDKPFHVGWYVKDFRTGETADRNGDTVVPSASVRKISIMMCAMRAVNEGSLSLEQRIKIQAKYQENDFGPIRHLSSGFSITLADALTMMIILSDNTCTGTIVDMLGIDLINAFCESVGMTGTTHRFAVPPRGLDRGHPVTAVNATTPSDVGHLLDLIQRGSNEPKVADRLGCLPEHCNLAIDILSKQMLSAALPSRLPYGTKVAHKTGTSMDSREHNDAGVVFQGDDPLFVLTVFTDHVPLALPDGMPAQFAGEQLIGQLARTCYDHFAS